MRELAAVHAHPSLGAQLAQAACEGEVCVEGGRKAPCAARAYQTDWHAHDHGSLWHVQGFFARVYFAAFQYTHSNPFHPLGIYVQ